MKKLMRLHKKQRGDTIIEVVLALTVLSLILGASAVLVSRNTRSLQSTQEHSSGARIAQTQLEYVKQFAVKNADQLDSMVGSGGAFCLIHDGSGLEALPQENSKCKGVDSAGNPVSDGAAYEIFITLEPVDAGDGYLARVNVRWEKLGGQTDQVQYAYRIYKKLGAGVVVEEGRNCPPGRVPGPGPGGCVLVTPSLKVTVNKVKPLAGNRQPTCASPTGQYKDGTRIKLTYQREDGTGEVRQGATAPDSAIFQNLVPHATYRAEMTVPNGYQACGVTYRDITLLPSAVYPVQTSMTIRPLCSSQPGSRTSTSTSVRRDPETVLVERQAWSNWWRIQFQDQAWPTRPGTWQVLDIGDGDGAVNRLVWQQYDNILWIQDNPPNGTWYLKYGRNLVGTGIFDPVPTGRTIVTTTTTTTTTSYTTYTCTDAVPHEEVTGTNTTTSTSTRIE